MNNETLTRKQKQKPCDLTNPVCISMGRAPLLTRGRWECKDPGSGGVPGAACAPALEGVVSFLGGRANHVL